MLRHGLTTVFLTVRLIRKNVTTVLSIGSGSTRSVSRREAWRLTVPIREVGFMPLYFSQFILYNVELVGQMMTSTALLVNCATDVNGSFLFRMTTRIWWSIMTVGPIRMALAYPIEVFVLLPLTYGIMRYRAVSSLSKSKVTVINTINNYAGGIKERAPAAWDPMHVCHLALEVTGLPWCASVFLVYRNSVLENGLWATWDCLKADVRSWRRGERLWHSLLRTTFLVLTGPLAFSAALLAGTFRPALAPVIRFTQASTSETVPTGLPQLPVVALDAIVAAGARAGLGAEPPSPPKNAMVRIYRLPHDIGLELFAAKATVLIGGDRLPEIAVVTDPRLLVRMPLKPVTNNTFAFDLLYSLGDTALRRSLENLTKVPANPFRNHVEVQKFVTADIDLDWDRVQVGGLTERQFILQGLRMAYALPSGGRVALRRIDPNADIYDYLTPETAKHHPGWTTRAFGGQTKRDAWAYSLLRAVSLLEAILGGDLSGLRSHVWLLLGVVKKQATRKPNDEEYRSRAAVIPEQELQIVWTHVMKPLMHFLEANSASWAPRFELFHGKLTNVWLKFKMLRDVCFVNEDMVDHGASLEPEVAMLIAQFYGELVTIDGERTTDLFTALFSEMVTAAVGVPDTDGHVHVLRTSRGMKDGVWGTSTIGGTYKIIGELHKIFTAWRLTPAMRGAYPDPLQLVSMCIEEVHGDNSLAAYPLAAVPFMSGTNASVAQVLKRIGLTVKPEESLLSDNLDTMTCMSWRMANLGSLTRPVVVGWKPTADVLKGFFLPERLTDFDKMGTTTRDYLGQILVSLYILGYWNGEARVFLEYAWRALWAGHEETIVRVLACRDFLYKTGMDPDKVQPVSSNSLFPYPPCDVVTLWVGRPYDRILHMTAPGAPTVADGARLCAPMMRILEGAAIRAEVEVREYALEPYDEEGFEGAGVFGRARPAPSVGGLPGGSPLLNRAWWSTDVWKVTFQSVIDVVAETQLWWLARCSNDVATPSLLVSLLPMVKWPVWFFWFGAAGHHIIRRGCEKPLEAVDRRRYWINNALTALLAWPIGVYHLSKDDLPAHYVCILGLVVGAVVENLVPTANYVPVILDPPAEVAPGAAPPAP